MRTIYADSNTKVAHEKFVGWLNSLINQYESSFYDDAVKNIIEMAFIREYKCFIQELYQEDGKKFSGFISILPTDRTNFIVMVHDLQGVPYLYNKTNGADMFEFDAEGVFKRFYENVTIDLFTENGYDGFECFITFEDLYGIKVPMYVIKNKGTNAVIGKGFLDVPYENKYSGTYMVNTKPLDEISYFEVTNISKSLIVVEIPILKNLMIKYSIRSNQTIKIPKTDWSDYFFRQSKDLGNITFKLIEL